jgi:dienelactone hydrolase
MAPTKGSRVIKLTTAVLFGAAIAVAGAARADDDTLFDVAALSSTPLRARTLRRIERHGVITEEVRFHSETDAGKDVDLFAYFSYPKGANHLPAFIWNPGGLGQASTAYTEPEARRGYAVLCIDFPQPGYRSTGNYPINQGLYVGADPKKAPIAHGVVALLKAVSYLESRREVDNDRIGMAGASWGGFFTTLMVGIDPRLKVGSCLYGTGNLQLGNAWWDGVSRNGKQPPTNEDRLRWQKTLDPAWRLPMKKTPIAWVTGTNDAFYSMPALMKTYEMTRGDKHLCLVPNWDHALPPEYTDRQLYSWLDVYLQGAPAPAKVTPVIVHNEGGRLIAHWTSDRHPVAADLIASYGEAGNWRGRYWHTFQAKITDHMCEVELPAATVPCYVSGSVSDERGLRSSTPLVRVGSAGLGATAVLPFPDYDGCFKWGGFHKVQIEYLVRHDRSGQRRWIPRLSSEKREGEPVAVLNPGATLLPPILSTAGFPHRFSCFLKADKPCRVGLQLGDQHHEFAVGPQWTEAAMGFTPPNELMGVFAAAVTVPSDVTVLISSVHFRPELRHAAGK